MKILWADNGSQCLQGGRETMVTLTAEVKEVYAKNKPYAIATASVMGIRYTDDRGTDSC